MPFTTTHVAIHHIIKESAANAEHQRAIEASRDHLVVLETEAML